LFLCLFGNPLYKCALGCIIKYFNLTGVWLYQKISPHVFPEYVHCRYKPNYSNSIQAVKKYRIGKDLMLSANRLISCRASVAMGTISECLNIVRMFLLKLA
jgi:putative component of membrane protein insertase Oxa1/YidC/SpoIIIJ protein YidD